MDSSTICKDMQSVCLLDVSSGDPTLHPDSADSPFRSFHAPSSQQQHPMEQGQFESAVQDLDLRFETSKSSGRLREGYWQDVDLIKSSNLPSGSGHYLRITRRNTSPATREETTPETVDEPEQPGDGRESTEADDFDEDSESLPKFATTPANNISTMTYDIIYSPTYSVPVLYIHKPLPPTFLVSVKGAGLSLVDHPVTLKPVYFVHPCRTQEALRNILPTQTVDNQQVGGMEWLMGWFGVVGAAAGLNVPLEVATEMKMGS